MYRYCLTLLLTNFAVSAEPITPISPSPSASIGERRAVDQASAEEKAKANTLWNEGMEAFSARLYKKAVKSLGEYIEKYPGTPEALDARYFLAQSHLFSKNSALSIPLFTSVIEIRGHSALGNEARVYLGDAYLDEKKFSEAYLVSEELLAQESIVPTLRSKALLLRAHAQSGLKKNFEAEKTLSAFQSIAENDPELEKEIATSYLISLLLKANHCDALPSSPRLPEDQVLDQIARKGVCVLEMGTYLAKASKKLSDTELSAASDAFLASFISYRKNCDSPPLIPQKTPKKNETAKSEISEKLTEDLKSTEKLLNEAFREREALKPLLSKMKRPK